MGETKVAAVKVKKHKSLAKGLVAGLIAGLAATAAKALAERIFPPHTHGELEPRELAVECVAADALTPAAKARFSEGLRWGLGASAGAAYGAVAEFYPEATARHGASFGLALEALSHEAALPALGLAAEPENETQTMREHTSEITSYVVYGVTAELVRRLVRRWL
jgi:putative membrane protein